MKGAELPSTRAKALVAAIFGTTVLLSWSIGAHYLPPYILPSVPDVLAGTAEFFTSRASLGHLGSTIFSIGSSIAFSFFVGALLALLAFYLPLSAPLVHHRLGPLFNSFPGIGWTLLAVVWFGVSTTTVIFSISVVLIPFALINLREGLVSLDGDLGEMGKSFGRSRLRQFCLIVAPAMLPFAAATLRIMFSVAWKVALTAELFGGSSGLGYLVNLARQEFDTRTIFTVTIFIVLLVYAADRFIFLPIARSTARRFGGGGR
ncbi:ABC transporter permease [Tardiphaga sp. 215_C5_N2_1]|uniref:ABC transporter permease n=1 Tax=Tardiphaga sp. 215_C5_N2_1 TaxID=3240774 RepID=UPI003F8B59B0